MTISVMQKLTNMQPTNLVQICFWNTDTRVSHKALTIIQNFVVDFSLQDIDQNYTTNMRHNTKKLI